MSENTVKTPVSDRLLRDEDDVVPWANKECIPLLREVRAAINEHDVVSDYDVTKISGNFTMTDEMVVEYIGTGGHTITLPSAASLSGRSRPRYVLCQGAGAASSGVVSVAPAGSDTLNGGTVAIAVATPGIAILVSDGVSKWTMQRSLGPSVTVDPVTIGVGFSGNVIALASADSAHNTNPYTLAYTLDFQGHNLPSNITGLLISARETNLGTGAPAHTPITLTVNSTIKFKVDNAGNLTTAGTLAVGGSPINFNAARAAAPATLADVIAVLQLFGLCS